MAVEDCLMICLISAVSALFSEGVSWAFIYRTINYKRLKIQIEKLNQQRK